MLGKIYRKIKTILFKVFNPMFFNAVLYEVPRVYFKNKLTLGEGVHINDNVFINAAGKVIIGNHTTISHGVTILSTGLETKGWARRDYKKDNHITKAVTIGDNVWLAANVTVCPGVTIASNTIVAAGAVVTNNLTEENCLYGGVPARKIKELA